MMTILLFISHTRAACTIRQWQHWEAGKGLIYRGAMVLGDNRDAATKKKALDPGVAPRREIHAHNQEHLRQLFFGSLRSL
jgi:hypothetical protein